MASRSDIDDLITTHENNVSALNSLFASTWVSSPSVRGTADILWSCISTLAACVYTALHLNVPSNTGTWPVLRLKILWVLVALLAPEIVVYMAISQLSAAWELRKGLRELFYNVDVDLAYCFFVVMGGVEVKNPQPSAARQDQSFLPVSPDTMLWVAREGHEIPIDPKRISDKSKANTIQKCLVVSQATWMAAQCLTRRAYGLPLTLLEVHTMVHVLCAAIIYAFWLKKPLDVREPERVDPEGWEHALALIAERASPILPKDLVVVVPRVWIEAKDKLLTFTLPDRRDFNTEMEEAKRRNQRDKDSLHGRTRPDSPSSTIDNQRVSTSVRWNLSKFDPEGMLLTNEALACGLANVGVPIKLTPRSLAYWESVKEGLDSAQRITKSRPRVKPLWLEQAVLDAVPLKPSLDKSNLQFPVTDLLLMDHFPLDRSLRNRQLLVAMILPAIYGGIHIAALSFDFPSSLESHVWLYSSLYIALGLPIWQVMAWFMVIYETASSPLGRFHRVVWRWIRSILGRLFLLGYAMARAYIIIESFSSLRHVPIGVYWTPEWLEMIPHL